MGDYMSKIAVMSDIHANIESLKYVLKDMEKRGVDSIICLGDLVTKYFYPEYVVDAVKKNCSTVIKGNCDALVVQNENYCYARSRLGLDRLEYLDNLKNRSRIFLNGKWINLYHSSPNSLDKIYNPLFKDNDKTTYKNKIIKDYNELFEDNDISIVGHTHQNYIAKITDELKFVDQVNIFVPEKIIINVGSAGEHSHMILENNVPKTIIDPYLTYALLDTNTMDVEIIKIPYKELLIDVYLDSLRLQNEHKAPYSPENNEKIRKSLKLMWTK